MNIFISARARTEQHKTCRDCVTLNSSVLIGMRQNLAHVYYACNDVIVGEKSNLRACSFKNVIVASGLLREAY